MAIKNDNIGEIAIYKPKNGKVKLEVSLKKETVWLSLNQLSQLFGRDKSVISKHLRNIYEVRELTKKATVAKFATVQIEGGRQVKRHIEYYNLDAIISLGYRVNSKQGTQFRIWATNILKDHLVKGYTLNEKRLKKQIESYKELKEAVNIIGNILDKREIGSDQASGLLKVIADFAYALDILDAYDYQKLEISSISKKKGKAIGYDETLKIISTLRQQYNSTELFGKERDKSLKSSLGNIFQTFGSKELYPSVEEKAANLLYFLVKNHHFIDGNKRIAAFLFLWFLEKNNLLYHQDGSKRIADNALVAITLMIAESQSSHQDVIVKVIVNLINKKNCKGRSKTAAVLGAE